MAVQTSYPTTIASAYVGQIANTELYNVISRTIESANVGFGIAMVQGAQDLGVKTGSGTFIGVTVRDRSVEAEHPDTFVIGSTAGLITKGVIWVVAGETVVAGGTAGFNATGKIVKAASGTAIPNARFDTGGASGELVKLRLG